MPFYSLIHLETIMHNWSRIILLMLQIVPFILVLSAKEIHLNINKRPYE